GRWRAGAVSGRAPHGSGFRMSYDCLLAWSNSCGCCLRHECQRRRIIACTAHWNARLRASFHCRDLRLGMPNPDTPCVVFKGRMMTLTVLEVGDNDIAAISAAVERQIERSPGFFARMPVLLSLQNTTIDLPALCEVLTAADLVTVGVLDADEQTAEAAQAAGLGVLTSPAGRAGGGNGNGRDAADDSKRVRER